MSNEAVSADLIMKLYDLRREPTMRDARNWYVSFFPESAQDVMQTMVEPKTSAYYRMVVSYWEMAASFVARGAIDEDMFLDSNGESLMVYAKIEPYVDEIRTLLGNPKYLINLEKVAMKQPDAKEAMVRRRALLRQMMEARADIAVKGYST